METLQRTANRGSISTGFDIDNSLKFEADNREYLRWTNFSSYASSARKKKFSMSVWVKRTEIGVQQVIWSTAANGYLSFEAADNIKWQQTYSGVQKTLNTNRVFRDTSAWYHIVLQVDTAQSTEADRTKLYINGVQETSFSSASYPSQGDEAQNLYEQHLILGEWGGGSVGFSGYIAEHYFLSEVALVPGDVGETDEDSGIWKPKAYGGTISSPSYFLEFQDSSDLGTATSGLDADTMNNISAADQATDTPTNNFCIVNNNTRQGNQYGAYNANQQATNGGTVIVEPTGSFGQISGTIGVGAGKWYWEVKAIQGSGLNTQIYGITSPVNLGGSEAARAEIYPGATTAVDSSAQYSIYPLYADQSRSYRGDSDSSANWTSSDEGSADDTIWRIALDLDNGKIWYGRNNVWLPDKDTDTASNPSTGSNARDTDLLGSTRLVGGFYLPSFGMYNENSGHTMQTNFGGYSIISNSKSYSDGNGYGAFVYEVPTGFYSICSKNLAEYG